MELDLYMQVDGCAIIRLNDRSQYIYDLTLIQSKTHLITQWWWNLNVRTCAWKIVYIHTKPLISQNYRAEYGEKLWSLLPN